MRARKDASVDSETKKAWEDNWSGTEVSRVLEIFNYPRVKRQIQIYAGCLPRNKPILEGGCGVGPYLIHFRQLGYKIIGIDYNHQPLVKIAQFDRKVPVACADVLRLPFGDSSFGAYLSLGVIEHFTEGPLGAIKEAHRVLENEGYFIIQVPRKSLFKIIKYPWLWLKANNRLRKFFGKEQRVHYWEQYFSVSELSSLLRNSGFSIKLIAPVDHEHALMDFMPFLFRKRNSYDGANKFGELMGKLMETVLPWPAAAGMILICKKGNREIR